MRRCRVLLAALLFALPATSPAAAAETRWYRIEVLAFTQHAGTREQPLRPLPSIPADARTLARDPARPTTLGQLELMQPLAVVREGSPDDLGRWIDSLEDRTHVLGTDGRLAEIGEWQPAPKRPSPESALPVDPRLAAEIADAERLERERRAKIAQSRPYRLPPEFAYRPLPAFALQLPAAAARLAAREGFTPLLHRAWLQPAEAGAGATPVLLQGDDADVQALAQLQATEVPLLSLSVWRSPAANASATAAPAAGGDAAEGEAPRAVGMLLPITRLRASVRATSGRVFYLDAPGIGALVRVDFVNRDIAEQLGGL